MNKLSAKTYELLDFSITNIIVYQCGTGGQGGKQRAIKSLNSISRFISVKNFSESADRKQENREEGWEPFQGLSVCKKLNESAGRKERSISRFNSVE